MVGDEVYTGAQKNHPNSDSPGSPFRRWTPYTPLPNFEDPLAPDKSRRFKRSADPRPPPGPSPRGARSGGAGPAPGTHAPRLASGLAPAAPGLRPGPRGARCWLPAAAGFVPRADSPSRWPSPRLHPHPTGLVKVSPRAASPAPPLPPTGALTAPQTNHRVTNRSQMQIPRQ